MEVMKDTEWIVAKIVVRSSLTFTVLLTLEEDKKKKKISVRNSEQNSIYASNICSK